MNSIGACQISREPLKTIIYIMWPRIYAIASVVSRVANHNM